MKFTNKKTKKSSARTLSILFFQETKESILKSLQEYIEWNHFTQTQYFNTHPLPLKFKYSGDVTDFQQSFPQKPTHELFVVGTPPDGLVSHEILLTLKLSGAIIKLIPAEIDLLTGLVEISHIHDIPHIKLFPDKIGTTQKYLKKLLAIFISIPGIILTGLMLPLITLLIKTTSRGPVLYRQKRLGKNARPFTLYKFRTMRADAEKDGPQLSGDHDTRITRTGKFLRYWHIDELPQFWNILKGDMALVGPRPERPFFAHFLSQKIPYYKVIYQQKPGLTSLGMIKYGYASNTEEMTDRLFYDIVYLNNPSLAMDSRILLSTIRYLALKIFYSPSEKRREKRQDELKTLTSSNDPIVRWLSFQNKVNG
ncbi:sugar transferase [Marinilabilia salmonicolor]|uniref:sugar transferase n=1 Tax=Marinilabilia salmonicolor TaxID=989 RepID=UPI00029B25AE|nr:sugar transferase [Marinilabilia salmonicolor]